MRIRFFSLAVFASMVLSGDTLGFFEQKFSSINFEKNRWDRTEKQGCYIYAGREDGAIVEVLRYGTANLVPFRGKKGLAVTICGDIAAFDEGFEAMTKQNVSTTSR